MLVKRKCWTQKFQSMILSNIVQTTYIARFWYFDVLKVSGAWSFAFWCISDIEHLFHHARPEHSKTPLHTSKPHKHTYTSPICSQSPPPGISGQFRTRTDTNRNQRTPNDTKRRFQAPQKAVEGCVAAPVHIELLSWCLLVPFGVWRHLLVSHVV